ncbi:MAG: hypothetical protein DRN03_01875 [Thermoplasmata archaeon]|nr:MAG: hypothetical protein DRN03_01875 [Thermoplasmata archaeon]
MLYTEKIAIIGLVFLMLLSQIPTKVLSYELDEEKIAVYRGSIVRCHCDRINGGSVIGFFVVFNLKNGAYLVMIFRKFVLPGHIALDMLCTNISINVIDHNGTVFYHIELKENDCLFVNNWFKVQNLQKPPYGKFYVVEIKIFGNYE